MGANCGNGIDVMVELARELRSATDGYPCSSIPTPASRRSRRGEIVYPETPAYMAERFETLVHDVGVNIVGGCCGTAPDHIRALVDTLRGKS